MPELAEVEFYRRVWNPGLGELVCEAGTQPARIFRGENPAQISAALAGARFTGSEARAKQMLFWFTAPHARHAGLWVGLHLGMTGELRVEPADFAPTRHDHFILRQKTRALVFRDPRQFGRVRFHAGPDAPPWWSELPPALTSEHFTVELAAAHFRRRARSALKTVLLDQRLFPGVGNWMADEILWRARLSPERTGGQLAPEQIERLWREVREVCAVALAVIGAGAGETFGDPPPGWFYHARWTAAGRCPRCEGALSTATIGGRTTRWCPVCQRG